MDTDGSVPTPLPSSKSGRPPPTLAKFSSSAPPTGLGGVKTLECEQPKMGAAGHAGIGPALPPGASGRATSRRIWTPARARSGRDRRTRPACPWDDDTCRVAAERGHLQCKRCVDSSFARILFSTLSMVTHTHTQFTRRGSTGRAQGRARRQHKKARARTGRQLSRQQTATTNNTRASLKKNGTGPKERLSATSHDLKTLAVSIYNGRAHCASPRRNGDAGSAGHACNSVQGENAPHECWPAHAAHSALLLLLALLAALLLLLALLAALLLLLALLAALLLLLSLLAALLGCSLALDLERSFALADATTTRGRPGLLARPRRPRLGHLGLAVGALLLHPGHLARLACIDRPRPYLCARAVLGEDLAHHRHRAFGVRVDVGRDGGRAVLLADAAALGWLLLQLPVEPAQGRGGHLRGAHRALEVVRLVRPAGEVTRNQAAA
eukprot:scaffold188_cov107-Isochrysis_galbana.AAC.9